MVAVTLLLACSVSGVVYANMDNVEDTTDDIKSEIMSVGESIDDTGRYIEAGLGNIINEISIDPNGGSLVKRTETFEEKADAWLKNAFPLSDKGVTATLTDYSIQLGMENLKVSDDGLVNGSRPCFLRATGYADIEYTSASSVTSKKIQISADGTSGLPFVIDSITEFELSSSGSSSALTELMTYQLSSLAQHRIMNGYGSTSATGEKGTESIITETDVEESFRSSLSIIESLCFRSTGDNTESLNSNDRVDAAELLIAKNGYFELDVSAVVSQALVAVADQFVNKWIELFFLDDAVDALNKVDDHIEYGLRFVVGTIFNKDLTSSKHYISEIMGKYGYSESDYRYVGGQTMKLTVFGGEYMDGNELVTIEPFEIEIEGAGIDIFSWGGWGSFLDDGILSVRTVEEKMKNIVNGAAINASKNIGSIRVSADAFDGTAFFSDLSEAMNEALKNGLNNIENAMTSSVENSRFCDPSYTALFNKLDDNLSEIYDVDEIQKNNSGKIKNAIRAHLKETGKTILDENAVSLLAVSATLSPEYEKAYAGIDTKIQNSVSLLKSVLTKVPGENDENIKALLGLTLKAVIKTDIVSNAVTSIVKNMTADISEYQEFNTKSTVIDLENSDSFRLTDGDGNVFTEYVSIEDDYDLDIKIIQPRSNKSKCIHNIGITEFNLSPYTTVFTVSLNGDVGYSVSSASPVLTALGWSDAASKGNFSVTTSFDIACVSGWALTGVEYTKSSNIITEAVRLLLKAAEPLFEPLKEVFIALKQLSDLCSTAIVEISSYVNAMISEFYNKIMEPIEKIQEIIESQLMAIFDVTFDVGLGYQSFTFSFYGMALTVEFRAATLTQNTKSLCKVKLATEIGETSIEAGFEVKYNEKNGIMFKGTGKVKADDWAVDLTIDPFMKFSKKILSATGTIRGIDFTAVMPEIVQYDQIEASVSDIPGVGEILSNIPLPIPGVKGSFDMGVDLRYNMPIQTGLMINEFESNPAGDDRGKEFVELYNATGSTVDLSGYRLVPGSNESKAIELSGTIKPFEKKVFYFDGFSLKNTGKTGSHSGESVTLYDADENIVDSTPWKSDSANDDSTWQRSSDGSKTWMFKKGTPGKSNGVVIKTNAIAKTFIVDSLKTAGEKALYQMGNHLTSVEEVAEFLKRMLEIFIETVIEKIADMLVSAAVFIQMELSDIAGTQHAGVKLSLEMNSELIEEGLTWLISQTGLLGSYVKTPECSDPLDIVCNDTYFRTTVYTGMSAPKILNRNVDGLEITVGLSVGVNISGLFTVCGNERGTWKVDAGVVIEDCPFELAVKKLSKEKGEHCDMWLLRMQFSKSE